MCQIKTCSFKVVDVLKAKLLKFLMPLKQPNVEAEVVQPVESTSSEASEPEDGEGKSTYKVMLFTATRSADH